MAEAGLKPTDIDGIATAASLRMVSICQRLLLSSAADSGRSRLR
jgi:hypothetical protein